MPRLFAAIRVPPNDRLRALLRRLEELRGIKAVEPQNLHYTLRFLGDVPEEARDALVQRFHAARFDVAPFDVHICGTSAFPGPDRPKVVWVGCTPDADAPLERLADAVDAIADDVGLGPRDKPFVPHLTLARVKRPDGRGFQGLVQIVRETRDDDHGPFRVEAVHLVESTLSKGGPVYTDIAEVRL